MGWNWVPGYCHMYAWLIRRGFPLYDWIDCTLYIHNWGLHAIRTLSLINTLQFTVTHAPGFSVFTSHILATDLSYCNFKSYTESSLFSLIPFLPLFCNSRHNSIPLLLSSFPGRLAFETRVTLLNWNSLYKHFVRITRKTQSLLLTRSVYWSVA
jgi:hypothetical protein